MFTGSTTYPGVTITAVMAIATAMLQCGTAGADPSQDDHFLAVLQDKQIPAMENTATVVAAGHTVCRKLDDGMPAQDVLAGLTNDAYGMDPRLRDESERLSVSMGRFIAAAVEVYCPGDQSKIVALPASRTWRSDGAATHVLAAASYRASASRTADRPGADTHGALLGAPVDAIATGDASQPKPPKIPPPKVPEAKAPRSPGVVTKPPPRQQPPPQTPPPAQQFPPPPEVQPPPPEQPPPPPQQPPQNEPPAGGPQSGGAAEGGGGTGDEGGGSGGGGSPAAPPQAPRPPGMIQLVPW